MMRLFRVAVWLWTERGLERMTVPQKQGCVRCDICGGIIQIDDRDGNDTVTMENSTGEITEDRKRKRRKKNTDKQSKKQP